MFYRFIVFCIGINWLMLLVYQDSFAQYGDIHFENISSKQGLYGTAINCIYQDSKGFLWIGREEGLLRYDGYSIKSFYNNPDDSFSLSSNDIQVIIEDSSNILWIGTYGGGLNRYDMNTEIFTSYKFQSEDSKSISNNIIQSILKDYLGNLWIGTYGGGLNKVETDNYVDSISTFIRYAYSMQDTTSLAGDEIFSILEDKNKNLWIGTNKCLSRYVRENDNFINYKYDPNNPRSLSSGEVYSIYEDKQGILWIGTSKGGLNKAVFSFNNPFALNFIHYQNNPYDATSINDNSIRRIYEDNLGNLLIGTFNRGLNVFEKDKDIFTHYLHNSKDHTSLGGNLVTSICEDNSGIIWIATYDNGSLNKFDRLKEQFNPYRYYLSKTSIFNEEQVFQMYEGSLNVLWVTTYNGLYKFDRKNDLCINYTHDPDDPASLSNNKVHTVCEDRLGNIWVGTIGGGLNKFNRDTEKFFRYKNDPDDNQSLSNDIVLSVYEDRSGTMWIGTYGGGLSRFDKEKNTFHHYTYDTSIPTSLSNNRVLSIFEDREGILWISTWGGGLNKFDRDKEIFIHYVHNPNDSTSISSNIVHSVYEDNNGTLWIGTEGGLNSFDRKKELFKSYRVSDGLSSDMVFGVLEDDNGCLWLSTTKGLSKFNPLNETFRNYDEMDGLQDDVFNFRAYLKTKSGELIFGGAKGINIFHPDSVLDNYHIPPVVITDFKLFNKSVPVGFYNSRNRTILDLPIEDSREIELTYDENIFSFEFAALDFHAPEKNQYAYIMEEFEENWNYTDASRRFVTYTNLDPGEYTFRVKASNNHGVWNEEGASLKIIILPPWWATTWAYIIYAIIILSLIYFTWKLQLKRIRIKHDYEMSKFEAEKMHEVDEMKSRFFANISHEFRTPLTLIFGPAKDVIEETNEPNTKKKVGVIQRNANRLSGLVNQLLDLSKLEAGKMKLEASEQNILPLLKGYVFSFSSLAERKKIKLNFNAAEDNFNVYIDRDKVEKIITNLLSNAFKFTPEEGRIDVTVEKRDGWAEIEITDNGIGIAKERLNRIFDRFYQVDGSHTRESEGVGIGLSLTKELIELHKGKIEVESEYGKGTTFKILLPLGKEHLKPDEIAEKEVSEEIKVTSNEDEFMPEVKKLKERKDINVLLETDKPILLIVEDNSDLRSYIVDLLKPEFRIHEAVDGEDGLNQSIKHIPDLIISDVMMPKMDGFELCNKLKTDERTSHIPTIMLTAKATNEDKIVGYETGADDYIMKPFESDVLKARIKNLIGQRRKLREQFRKEGLIKIEDQEITSIDKKFLQGVIKIINNHLSDTDFTVEMLSDEVCMSRRNLDRKLVALTGESPGDLIRRLRLTRAAKLITQNFGNISEIAVEVGFSNPAYFSKCFSEQFGLSPSEYKTNNSK